MKDDIIYYPQLLLDKCIYKRFINNPYISDLEFTETEPDSESDEEEVNENTVV